MNSIINVSNVTVGGTVGGTLNSTRGVQFKARLSK